MDRLIWLQFTTLKSKYVRHAILGAFGCGDFNNPPERVACLYRKYLQLYEADFDVIGFPIYYAGHGLANFDVFSKALTFFEVNNMLIRTIVSIQVQTHIKNSLKWPLK